MTTYTTEFYKGQMDGSLRSARHVVPIIMELFQPHSVVDAGCGVGTWLNCFNVAGVKDICGIDGDYVDKELLQIPSDCFLPRDLTKPLLIDRQFDLAMSLEVAEHLPEPFAASFVAQLTELAPAVLFSAGIPGQTGNDHINEQWPAYWAAKFGAEGYVCLDIFRPILWAIPDLEWWYAQNILLYVTPEINRLYQQRIADLMLKADSPLSLVHPACLEQWIGRHKQAKDSCDLLKYSAVTLSVAIVRKAWAKLCRLTVPK